MNETRLTAHRFEIEIHQWRLENAGRTLEWTDRDRPSKNPVMPTSEISALRIDGAGPDILKQPLYKMREPPFSQELKLQSIAELIATVPTEKCEQFPVLKVGHTQVLAKHEEVATAGLPEPFVEEVRWLEHASLGV